MKVKFLLFLLLLLLFSSCTTTNLDYGQFVFSSSDVNSEAVRFEELFSKFRSYRGTVCFGISGPYASKVEAVKIATENCLQYLTYANGLAVQASYNRVVNTVNNVDAIKSDVIAGSADSIYTKTSSEMTILDVVDYGGSIGVAVFASIPNLQSISYKKTNWIKNCPEIEGYNVAVGTSEYTYANPLAAIEAATFKAAQMLLDMDSSAVIVNGTIIENKVTNNSSSFKKDSYSISGVRMNGFRAIDYKYDPDDKRVYALVVSTK